MGEKLHTPIARKDVKSIIFFSTPFLENIVFFFLLKRLCCILDSCTYFGTAVRAIPDIVVNSDLSCNCSQIIILHVYELEVFHLRLALTLREC